MSNPFENRSTPANLRLLADQIERHDSGEDVGLPDYAFVREFHEMCEVEPRCYRTREIAGIPIHITEQNKSI